MSPSSSTHNLASPQMQAWDEEAGVFGDNHAVSPSATPNLSRAASVVGAGSPRQNQVRGITVSCTPLDLGL